VNYYLEHGLEKSKFVMGLPFYGRGWTLMDAKHIGLNDTAKGMSGKGPLTRENGILGYNEICAMVRAQPTKFSIHHDPYYRAPYVYNETIWMGFDNHDSITCKVSFLKSMGLSGGMVWSLENDDFKNRCEGGRYPLLNTVHNMLNGNRKDVSECLLADVPVLTTTRATEAPPTEAPTPVPSLAPATQKIDNNHTVVCEKQGYQPHPTDPHQYIFCEYVASTGKWWIHIMPCSPGTRWHQPTENCIAEDP